MNACFGLVLFGYGAGYVNYRQNREDEGLQYSHENMKQDEWNWADQWNYQAGVTKFVQVLEENGKLEHEAEKKDVKRFAHEHVDPETNGKREQARQIAYDLDGQHDGRHREDRAQKMLAVAERPVFHDAGPVVVEEYDDRAAERDRNLGRGRLECRDQADEIIQKHENADAAEHGDIFIGVVADIVFQEIADADAHGVCEQRFHALLRPARSID